MSDGSRAPRVGGEEPRSGSVTPAPPRPAAPPRGPAFVLALVTAVLAAWVPAGADGQGFGIYEHGSCTMGRAGAAVAEPCDDGSAVFFNPAGLTSVEGTTVTVGGTLISAFGDFTDDATGETFDLDNDPIPVPHGFAVHRVDDRLAAGIGVFVPYGLETRWPSGRDAGFPGRFAGYDNSLQSFYVQPTVAYRPHERVSIGAGLDVVVGTVELRRRLDLSRQSIPGTEITFGALGVPARTDFADAHLDADPATGVGGNLGVRVEVTDRVAAGARYMTQVTLDYEGDASFEQVPTGLTVPTDVDVPGGPTVPAGTPVDALLAPLFGTGGPLGDQTVTTSITMPDQLVAGLAYRPSERLLLEADWQWVDWSDFDRVGIDLARAPDRVRIQNYRDTHGLRLGAELGVTPDVDVRGGYLYHGAAAPDETVTPLLPESDRNELTAGVGARITSAVSVDAAYHYIAQNDRRGRVVDPPAGVEPATELNSGLYSFGAHLVGLSLTFRF